MKIKRGFFVFFLLVGAGFVFNAAAQVSGGTMVVDTEKIFKALPDYNAAIAALDTEAKQQQAKVDADFAELEKVFNAYQSRKWLYTDAERQQQEDQILTREKEITAYQEKIFGQEGELMKKRVAVVKPIQDRVFAAINEFALAGGYSLVLDVASNPMVLYYGSAVDKTLEITQIVLKK